MNKYFRTNNLKNKNLRRDYSLIRFNHEKKEFYRILNINNVLLTSIEEISSNTMQKRFTLIQHENLSLIFKYNFTQNEDNPLRFNKTIDNEQLNYKNQFYLHHLQQERSTNHFADALKFASYLKTTNPVNQNKFKKSFDITFWYLASLLMLKDSINNKSEMIHIEISMFLCNDLKNKKKFIQTHKISNTAKHKEFFKLNDYQEIYPLLKTSLLK
mmetsp:Transcript_9136/g.22418  ORF Transcript_9136/g.22418 Transcript_9136/m.22418 type:complete len:214 (-) Transcript_9136:416-1057(-)